MKKNYYLEQVKEIATFTSKPKLLMHTCCAVCATFPLEYLTQYFELTLYFNNSNIYPATEYHRRLEELKNYLKVFNEEHNTNVKLIITAYDNKSFTKKLSYGKDLKEGKQRCFYCYATRMDEAYRYADQNGYDYFTTVMTISRQKNSQKLNEIGAALARKYRPKYFFSDFKKKNGNLIGNMIANKKGLYKQDYCGCVYSYNERKKNMCIFCKIVDKEIPSKLVYEDELVMAFLDLSQTTKGHTLVIPKKHYDNILECDKDTLKHLIDVTQDLTKQIITKLNAKGANILTNCNEVAGQTVMHFHVHIIPRYDQNDPIQIKFSNNEMDLDEILAQIKE